MKPICGELILRRLPEPAPFQQSSFPFSNFVLIMWGNRVVTKQLPAGHRSRPSHVVITPYTSSRHVQREIFRCYQHVDRLHYCARELGLPLQAFQSASDQKVCPAQLALPIATATPLLPLAQPSVQETQALYFDKVGPRGGQIKKKQELQLDISQKLLFLALNKNIDFKNVIYIYPLPTKPCAFV